MAALLTLAILIAGLAWAPAAFAGTWRELHRPLHLPEVDPAEPCPISPVDERVDWDRINIFGGSGIGPGPAYPGLGGSGGQVSDTPGQENTGWFATKVFWYVRPSYTGRVLIRGRRLDDRGRLGFSESANRPSRELRIQRGDTVQWRGQPEGSRGVPSGLWWRASGCYGIQVDGTRFSRTVVFAASAP